jgi:hypothetical protein
MSMHLLTMKNVRFVSCGLHIVLYRNNRTIPTTWHAKPIALMCLDPYIGTSGTSFAFNCFLTGDGKGMVAGHPGGRCWSCDSDLADALAPAPLARVSCTQRFVNWYISHKHMHLVPLYYSFHLGKYSAQPIIS